VQDLKISPDGRRVAFGAHGGVSPIEIWEISNKKFS